MLVSGGALALAGAYMLGLTSGSAANAANQAVQTKTINLTYLTWQESPSQLSICGDTQPMVIHGNPNFVGKAQPFVLDMRFTTSFSGPDAITHPEGRFVLCGATLKVVR